MKNNTFRKLDEQKQAEMVYFPTTYPTLEPKEHSGLLWKVPFAITFVAGLLVCGIWIARDEPLVDALLTKADAVISGTVQGFDEEISPGLESVADEVNQTTITDEETGNVVAATAYKEETMDVRLTNMYGATLDETFVNGTWTLSQDQDVLVWMDLPTDIAELYGRVESTFPYEVKAGETGIIEIKVTSYENDTIYSGTLEFVAADDLTLEAGVRHNPHGNSGDITFWNDSALEMNCLDEVLQPGKNSYLHYSLFTSAENEPIIFYGGYSSTGYDMAYDVRALGDFAENDYRRVHGSTYYEDLKGKMLPLESASSDELDEQPRIPADISDIL